MSIHQSEPDEQGFSVETHVGKGLPGFDIIGAHAHRVRRIRDRVDEMLASNGWARPQKRITVNVIGPWRPNIAIAQAIYDSLQELGEIGR